MAFQFHTYGPSCRLRAQREPELDSQTIPKLRAQYFHYSRQPIDEPLSSTPFTAEPAIRAFSAYDNDRLEEAWRSFLKRSAEEKPEEASPGWHDSSGDDEHPEASASKRIKIHGNESGDAKPVLNAHSDPQVRNAWTRVTELREGRKELGRERRTSLDTPRPSLAQDGAERVYTRPGTGDSKESIITQRRIVEDIADHTEDTQNQTVSRPKLAPRTSTSVGKPKVETLVGLSRLHSAIFPDYGLKPIYWSQVGDNAPIMRGTWFYKVTMEPVEAPIANLLEKGYQYMKPWTQTYKDEVASCLAVGPEAETHLVHHLVPESEFEYESHDEAEDHSHKEEITIDKAYKARGFLKKTARRDLFKNHRNFSVIYANSKSAQLLRPNQIPSASRGRKPLKFIVKEQEVGTIVVRGFDNRAWDKKHPLKNVYPPSQYRRAKAAPRTRVSGLSDSRNVCQACEAEKEDPNVTDLVLVIHGIGQKLSEKMESFAFTHSITTLRRDFLELLLSEDIQPILRPDLGTVMPLPINWRAKMKAEDIASDQTSKDIDSEENSFSLEDVTVPHMLQTRGFINDVFADIPYYMSNRQEGILSTVVKEANRVYNEWCKHTPGFREKGRVHIVGHSLGSVIAMDILSQQPTSLSSPEQQPEKGIRKLFDFDTKNAFFLGSPLGFFFHLNHASLVPRKGRVKEGSPIPINPELGGEGGHFGCPAADNIYNIIHPHDPVSYRLNPCVDVKYAASIKPAYLPSLDAGWMSGVFGKRTMTLMRPTTSAQLAALRPTVAKLPSNVEMEVHDFTKEEKAENKMFLLNDNGQIDWMLTLPRGFELPYLSVLYAHSSYWLSKDFARFLVVEIGRASGRNEALPSLRAAKKGHPAK
ncbi:hypothetical protein MMC10_003761 [Thelotrema lepadinum]|nr:hypothetical protein [Thelotrema lepadinum]